MSKGVIHSGASPQRVAADPDPLVDFQEEGLALDELDALL